MAATLDKDNIEFNKAAEFVRHTDKLVYLTGKAGTGKTTFLKYIKDSTDKNTVILAPTGIAAINAGGVTIHSFFQIPFGPFVPNDSRLQTFATGKGNKESIYRTFRYQEEKLEIIKNLELLIIDEISMVRADVLDVIDRILRVFRKNPSVAFGGVQVILIGDTFQLPPIADHDQWAILSQFYESPFFFSSRVIEQNPPVYIELKKIYRQNEQEFIDLLNRVRVNQLTPADFKVLNSKYEPDFSANGSDYIILATHNKIVNETNLNKLRELETDLFSFAANVSGEFPEQNKPTDHSLKLKVGAQIMFIKNDSGESKRYFNGKIGSIKQLKEDSISVGFDDGSEVEVKRNVWSNIQYTYNQEKKKVEEEVVGSFEQFPIRLAWAITVHKSQGLTFDNVIADLSRAFAPGQVYVALSRCSSFNGLKLRTRLTPYSIKTDPKVMEFARKESPGSLVTEQLNTGKADFYYKKAREHFAKGGISASFGFFKRALKFRNDINTDTFEKFIKIQGNRLLGFRQKYEQSITEQEQLLDKISQLEQENGNWKTEVSEKEQKLADQDVQIDLLLHQNQGVKKRNKDLSKENKGLEEKIAAYERKIHQLETQLKTKELKLLSKITEVEASKTEIQRLKNLKWYKKVIRKN